MINTRSSTIRVYEQCKRKWMLQHIRQDVMKSKAMDWGTEMHLALENWFKHGTVPNENTATGKAAMASLKHLPPPSPSLSVEHTWLMSLFGDTVLYSGTIDLADFTVRKDEKGKSYALMFDHKSTAGLEWIKTAEDLANDISACAYAYWMTDAFDLHYVKCRWVYTTRDAKQSVPVDFIITRDAAKERWEKTMSNLADMVKLMENRPKDVMTAVEGNLNHCNEFGGCPYKRMCGIADEPSDWLTLSKPATREKVIMASALLAQLKKQSAPTQTNLPLASEPLEDVLIAINPPAQGQKEVDLSAIPSKDLIAELTKRLK